MGLIERIKNFDIQICKYNLALFLRAMILLTPVMFLFYKENGLTVVELFWFQAFFYLTMIILEIPVGYLSDKISKKRVLLLSFIIFLFVTIMWLNLHGYWVILLGEILLAVSKVMLDNVQSGYLYDYLLHKDRPEKMPKNYGYQNFFLAFGTAVAAIAGAGIYAKYGSKIVLLAELIISLFSIYLVMSLPSVYKPKTDKERFLIKIKDFCDSAKLLYKKESIRYYILYSGFLTSFSIVFALSFQPLMLKAMFSVALFGLVAFLNHGIRAVSSAITGKITKFLNIRKMIIPLYFLFIVAFGCIFLIFNIKSRFLILFLIFIVCLIIGIQLIFTIRHVSRLHKFVESKDRGMIISVNNLFSRSTAFVMLFSSKIFIDKLGFQEFYLIMFCLFMILGFILMYKSFRIKENIDL